MCAEELKAIKLLPCPNCGEFRDIGQNSDREWHIYCFSCKMRGPAGENEFFAAAAWNALPRKPQGVDEALLAQAAMRHYGLENCLNQMQEELAEAMAAINHWRRGRPGAREELAEELADVLVVMEQLQVELGPEIARWVAEKKERLSKHAWFVEAQQGREPVI